VRSASRSHLLAAAVLAVGLALMACVGPAPSTDPATPAAGGAAFPVTIEHALGETVIPAAPARVVTWGFGTTDTALALGVVPVAIPQQAYGGDAQGILPWIGEELAELGAPTPTILPNPTGSDVVPFEPIAAAAPDLILATYSGITADDYATLSRIAPTVAYPDQPWATPWRDVVTITGEALGKPAEAAALITDTESVIAAKAAEHPELTGKTVAAVWDTGDAFSVYKPADPRVEFLTDLGLVNAPSVDALSTDESTFYFTLSTELVGELTSDVLVSYADTPEAAQRFLQQPYAQTMQQVADGRVASVTGQAAIAAVSPPTVLSLPWGVDGYLDALSEAVG
jgi:iron complex transport system substrate-binding protein